MEKILEVNNLRVSFFTQAGEVQAVRDINFSMNSGETVAIVGESGCGKSVTSKTIMGLLPKGKSKVKDGKVLYRGNNILTYTSEEKRKFCGGECAMIFQDALSALNPTLMVERQVVENLRNHTNLNREEQKKQAIDILKRVGIADAEQCMKKYPIELSGGMRQRVMIASAIICHPQILIADEPTTALDVTIQAQVLDLLKEIQAQTGMAILLITHDLGVVSQMADRIVVMYAGKIVEQGRSEDIFYSPKHPYTWALLQSVPRLKKEGIARRLRTIEGNLPSAIDPPKGCVFAERCPYCMNICCEEEPETYQCGECQKVSCWLQEKMADKTGIPFLKEEE